MGTITQRCPHVRDRRDMHAGVGDGYVSAADLQASTKGTVNVHGMERSLTGGFLG